MGAYGLHKSKTPKAKNKAEETAFKVMGVDPKTMRYPSENCGPVTFHVYDVYEMLIEAYNLGKEGK